VLCYLCVLSLGLLVVLVRLSVPAMSDLDIGVDN